MSYKKLILYDTDGKAIFDDKIIALNLSEQIVVQNSVKYFDDPSPCFIHRSAVMKKLFVELEDFLENSIKINGNELKWRELPEDVKGILSAYDGISSIKYHL